MADNSDLPDEIWTSILEYLEPEDIVQTQLVSRRLLKLARDTSLWRIKCFERAPSAVHVRARRGLLPAVVAGISTIRPSPDPVPTPAHTTISSRTGPSKRARNIAQWDQADDDEHVDWYREFMARSAPLNVIWSDEATTEADEIRGVAVHPDSERAVTCQEDGSVAIWDIREQEPGGRKFKQIAQGRPGELFSTLSGEGESSKKPATFSGVTECLTLDSDRGRAYIAIQRTLNEVDLETLQVVSQQPYAWPITALSQESKLQVPLSVGTSWSLHLYDPRMLSRDRSRSPEDLMRDTPGEPEASIAFLPNYTKQTTRSRLDTGSDPYLPQFPRLTPLSIHDNQRGRSERSDFAHVEPGPLSILHHQEHEIFVAGRFPSILSYDRRFFPRLQYVMHSGARLSALTTIPHAPKKARGSSSNAVATLVACGEYGGRGSLEIYSLPHQRARQPPQQSSTNGRLSDMVDLELDSPDLDLATMESPGQEESERPPYSYKNRQEASSAKLLSVATQGTRIVFSDAEGGLKWVERDGRGLARRWNLNSTPSSNPNSSHSWETGNSELVARKIVPLSSSFSSNPTGPAGGLPAANDDLLIWTGEKLGIVTTRPKYEDHEELVKELEEGNNKLDKRKHRGADDSSSNDDDDDDDDDEDKKIEEYGKAMRRALERQADERRWMSQFRLKRGLF